MFEVYYVAPADPVRETLLTATVSRFGGRLDFREVPDENGAGPVVLTYEFDDPTQAELAAEALRGQGEHVEGPVTYGD
jgi:hypothetical protein